MYRGWIRGNSNYYNIAQLEEFWLAHENYLHCDLHHCEMGICQTEHSSEFTIYLNIDVYTPCKTARQRDSMATEGEQKVHLAESKMNSLPKYSQKKGKAAFQKLLYTLLGEKWNVKRFYHHTRADNCLIMTINFDRAPGLNALDSRVWMWIAREIVGSLVSLWVLMTG